MYIVMTNQERFNEGDMSCNKGLFDHSFFSDDSKSHMSAFKKKSCDEYNNVKQMEEICERYESIMEQMNDIYKKNQNIQQQMEYIENNTINNIKDTSNEVINNATQVHSDLKHLKKSIDETMVNYEKTETNIIKLNTLFDNVADKADQMNNNYDSFVKDGKFIVEEMKNNRKNLNNELDMLSKQIRVIENYENNIQKLLEKVRAEYYKLHTTTVKAQEKQGLFLAIVSFVAIIVIVLMTFSTMQVIKNHSLNENMI